MIAIHSLKSGYSWIQLKTDYHKTKVVIGEGQTKEDALLKTKKNLQNMIAEVEAIQAKVSKFNFDLEGE